MSTTTPADVRPSEASRPKHRKAIGPRLQILFTVVLVLLALLGANSAYLAAITFLDWLAGAAGTHQTPFYLWMFLGHVVLGLLLIVPFVAFGLIHMTNTWKRKNRRAVAVGYALLSTSIVILVTGLLLVRTFVDLKQPLARTTVYWLHVLLPLAAGWLYWLHRLVGPKIRWRLGIGYGAAVGIGVAAMAGLHFVDPRDFGRVGPESGVKYFEPSLARTASGDFIPAKSLMNDAYCQRCHADVHARWSDSVHRFSSFNNSPYLASVSETRKVALERDGSVQASRWCAGCHDPVPFFSGAFDDPEFDVLEHPTSQAGITCTVCHSITHVNSNRGNADYTIEEPQHYPFAFSENSFLRWVNEQMVKAKPAFHKKTFLKPHHRTTEFCSTCHKVHLPYELNHYKEFLRGQNHYDPFLLSGVSGHGVRSFYYPPKAQANCNGCHMPARPSDDFGARFLAGAEGLSVHDHLFPSANTGIAWLRDRPEIVAEHRKFLDGVMRVDLFGVREDGEIDGELHAPLRPEVPTLEPGKTYLFETVIRTVKMGHLFTQGTVDSNEVWLDVTVRAGDRIVGRSGALDAEKGNAVDAWAHFVNVFMLDKDGNRIDRRNAQDIFTPLYNHQIPPGAGQLVHYELEMPEDLDEPLTVEVRLQYRKFDTRYMEIVDRETAKLGRRIRGHEAGEPYVNELPITTLAVDSVTFPVKGVEAEVENADRDVPEWQRWNDYGIGALLKGKAELRQALEAFRHVEELDRWDGPLNLARVHEVEGADLNAATEALTRAAAYADEPGFPRWTWAWLSGKVNAQNGRLEDAVNNLRSAATDRTPEMIERGFDFSLDYVLLNELGRALFDLGNLRDRQGRGEEAVAHWTEAAEWFEKALEIDSENVTAHFNLHLLYEQLGDEDRAAEHQVLHEKYKPDDNAADRAVRLARQKYPAADHAAEAVVLYPLTPEARQRILDRRDRGAAGQVDAPIIDDSDMGAE